MTQTSKTDNTVTDVITDEEIELDSAIDIDESNVVEVLVLRSRLSCCSNGNFFRPE
jgi:hypothetical protein